MIHSPFVRPGWRRAGSVLAALSLSLLAACGGGGGGAPSGEPVQPDGPVPVTPSQISGQVSFDYVPSREGKLFYAETQVRPVRGARLQVVDETGSVLAETRTDDQGRYSASIPAGRTVRLRVNAELDAGGARIQVTDNTRGDALYALESPLFAATTGPRDLHAPSGWTGKGYGTERPAAPFAILDTVYRSQAALRAVDPQATLRPLTVHWSPGNRAATGDRALGQIGGTHFTVIPAQGSTRWADGSAHIYVMGDENVNTDEYDEGVIGHEWGHYYQWVFSRNDSPHGPHAIGEPLDLAMAFSEGWGSAWSGLALDIASLSDAMGTWQGDGWYLPLDRTVTTRQGAFDENTVASVLWRFGRSQGLGPVHAAMRQLASSPAFSTLYAFSHAVRGTDAAAADALDALLEGHAIVGSARAGDPYGTGETNDGGLSIDGNASLLALPPYQRVAVGQTVVACSANVYGSPNKLGNSRYMKFDAEQPGTYRIAISGHSRADRSRAMAFVSALQDGQRMYGEANVAQVTWELELPAGPKVFSLADKGVLFEGQAMGCFDVRVTQVTPPSNPILWTQQTR